MLPLLRCRSVEPVDAPLCAGWLHSDCVFSARLNGHLAPLIARAFDESRMQGVIIERFDELADEWKPEGIGLSCFADSATVDAQLAAPQPFFFEELLLKFADGEARQLLGPDEQARANAGFGPGLDIVGHWMQPILELSNPMTRAVGAMAHEAYVRDHRGFRVNRMMHEDWIREFDIYLTFGYRAFATFPIADGPSRPAAIRRFTERTFYYSDIVEYNKSAPGTTVSYVMHFVPPVCRFTRAEQRILRQALAGRTDQQICAELDLSPNTLKSAWRSIYERVQTHVPAALGERTEENGSGVRGTEKRRSVIAFIEAHPQELRPYYWPR